MGRKPKLDPEDLEEIGKRLMRGDTPKNICDDFGVSNTWVSHNFGKLRKNGLEIAQNLADCEKLVESMPKHEQIMIRSLADNLKSVAHHLGNAATIGARTSELLAQRATKRAEMMCDDFDMEDSLGREQLKTIHALHTTANEAAKPGIELLKLAKAGPSDPTQALPVDEIDFGAMSDTDLATYIELNKKYAIKKDP